MGAAPNLGRVFELVIFDCDGVLVDSETISNRVLAETLTEAGLATTPAEAVSFYKGRLLRDVTARWQKERELKTRLAALEGARG